MVVIRSGVFILGSKTAGRDKGEADHY